MEDYFKPVKIAIIGLGYVGLPLALEFGKQYEVVGFDINIKRIQKLTNGEDHTLEINNEEIKKSTASSSGTKGVYFTTDINNLKNCTVYIITVPTPVDSHNNPDLSFLLKASETVSMVLKKGDTVIYESTVYPGCTEDDCVPVLEKKSGLVFNTDFFCGYSPERISPGDKTRTLTTIKKVTSGSTEQAAIFINNLYQSIIPAGTYMASSIKVAEAAKVIENSQRDINIAFVNELSKIFTLLGIDTNEVLEAASTKWNFLPFKPGLVGGHCIGLDPYYLAQKATTVGYHPEIILSGRRINDGMGRYVANSVIKLMISKRIDVFNSEILILGFTFKENFADIRNTKVFDIYTELLTYNVNLDIYDPLVDKSKIKEEYNINIQSSISGKKYDAIILAVAHSEFLNLDILSLKKSISIVYDVKNFLNKDIVDGRL